MHDLNNTNAVELVQPSLGTACIVQNAEKFIVPAGALRWAGEGGDTSPDSHRADDSASPEKLVH